MVTSGFQPVTLNFDLLVLSELQNILNPNHPSLIYPEDEMCIPCAVLRLTGIVYTYKIEASVVCAL